jgi:flagellar protein FlbD
LSYRPLGEISCHDEISAGWLAQPALTAFVEMTNDYHLFEMETELLLAPMIKLTKLNNSEFYLNPDLIKSIGQTPDTIIVLSNADHLIVREKPEEIIDKIVAYRVRLLRLSRQQLDSEDAEPH